MTLSKLWTSFLAASLVAIFATNLSAQKPTPEQARELVKDPAVAEQIKQRIGASGLTPEQVRARLKAEGYPEDLLDAYLSGSSQGGDAQANGQVISAIQELGIVDSTDASLLNCSVGDSGMVTLDTLPNGSPDTTAAGQARAAARRKELQQRCVAATNKDKTVAETKSDSGFNIFGLDFFRRQTTQFDPNQSGPVDANYRLGPGDRLVLVLTGDVEESYTLDVTREGFVVVPRVGQVWVNNLTLSELENVLYSRLGRVYSGVFRGPGATTFFQVSVSRLRSNQIFVTGNVVKPGSYRISSAGTALSALYAAGGPTDMGSLREVYIMRGGQRIGTLDVYDYIINGDASRDMRLQNGDVVHVPRHLARVRIVGEVTTPATYEIKNNETVATALQFAGGLRETASRQRIQIERILPPNERQLGGRDRVVTDIVSDIPGSDAAISVPVRPGDVIRVYPIASRVRNRVAVLGNVWQPGPQGLVPGMTISQAIARAGGLKPDTYLGQILITRTYPDSTKQQLHASLQDVGGNVLNDFALQEDDEIKIFSRSEFRPTRYVAINGAVRKSGRYPYREGMSVRDLVLLAGGLEQSAYLNEAEIARLPEDRSTGVTARTIRVPLDSSYLFERSPDGHYSGPPGLPAPAGPTPDVILSSYDNVTILRQPNWELQRTVYLGGEVRFPARYALINKNEKVLDLIKRAGGLTPEAYVDGVNFYRPGNGVIGIDLPKVVKNPRHRDNLLLQDGDSIYIPRYSNIINVTGLVNSPVGVTYAPGRDIAYYVRSAGGATRSGDLGRSYVKQPNGKVESVIKRPFAPDSYPVPRPGSVVFVPQKDPLDSPLNYIQSLGSIAQVVASLVAIIVAVR